MQRNLKWLYPEESTDFATPANWGWVDATKTDAITESPSGLDTVRFNGAPSTGEDKVVKLSSDTFVSNFFYTVNKNMGTTIDLANYKLTVSNNLSIANVYAAGEQWLEKSLLTFKDGAIEIPGSAVGGIVDSQPDEAASGFFMNRSDYMQNGFNVAFDNVSLVVTNAVKGYVMIAKTMQNDTSRIRLINGASWLLKSLEFKCDTVSPIEMILNGKESFLTTIGRIIIGQSAPVSLLFEAGATLNAQGGIDSYYVYGSPSNAKIVFNGGNHTVGPLAPRFNGDVSGAFALSKTDVVVSNKAVVTATDRIAIRSSSSFAVCDGAKVTTSKAVNVGYSSDGSQYTGDSTILVDSGTITATSFSFGMIESDTFTNNCLRVGGALSRLEATEGDIALNYNTKVAFEIPESGYCDENGVARVPVIAAGIFRMKTTDTSDPLSLELTTKVFDKKHPKESITLLQAGKASAGYWEWWPVSTGLYTTYKTKDALDTLTNNVVFVDSSKNPGKVTVSEDGLSLIYTAPVPMGVLISVR